jgi:hypothetical protein
MAWAPAMQTRRNDRSPPCCYLQLVDEGELEACAREHLAYELWMLVQTAVYLCNTPIDASVVERNAFLGSFTIHARVVGDFLANTNRRSGDVRASTFSETWQGEQVLAEFATTINRQVAHLTSSRLGKQPINVRDVTVRILEGFHRFLAALPETRHQWFDWYEVAYPPEPTFGE